MKNFYIAITVEQNKNNYTFAPPEDNAPYIPGYYAHVVKVPDTENLVNVMQRYPHIICANICETRKRAEQLAYFWNASYYANGTYLFDELPHAPKEV